jgi:hypothetical protein
MMMTPSLVDWDMRSDRNLKLAGLANVSSLVDWDMRSDRNKLLFTPFSEISLVDWDMRSDRNARGLQVSVPPV